MADRVFVFTGIGWPQVEPLEPEWRVGKHPAEGPNGRHRNGFPMIPHPTRPLFSRQPAEPRATPHGTCHVSSSCCSCSVPCVEQDIDILRAERAEWDLRGCPEKRQSVGLVNAWGRRGGSGLARQPPRGNLQHASNSACSRPFPQRPSLLSLSSDHCRVTTYHCDGTTHEGYGDELQVCMIRLPRRAINGSLKIAMMTERHCRCPRRDHRSSSFAPHPPRSPAPHPCPRI